MLEKAEWIKVNKSCHVLVDQDHMVLSAIFTTYDDTEGDENLIWDVEMYDEPVGSYVSLFSAKLAVHKIITDAEVEEKKIAEKKSKRTKTKSTVKEK